MSEDSVHKDFHICHFGDRRFYKVTEGVKSKNSELINNLLKQNGCTGIGPA